MRIRTALLASTAFAVVALASPAQARGPFYVTLGGGANWVNDDHFRAATAPTSFADTLTFNPNTDTGYVLHAAVGMHLDNIFDGLRAEIEGSYRHNNGKGNWTSNTSSPTFLSSGPLNFDETSWSVLANAWWDFGGGPLRPYFGGGIGWAESRLKGTYGNFGIPLPVGFDFSDSGFAWQVGAGVNWQLSPNVAIGVGYRYFVAPKVDIAAPYSSTATGNVDVNNSSVMLDVTFAL